MTRTHNFIILAFVLVSHKTFWSGCFAPVACCGRGGGNCPAVADLGYATVAAVAGNTRHSLYLPTS